MPTAGAVAAVEGRINDTDAHEFVPAAQWTDVFGPATGVLADVMKLLPPDSPFGLAPHPEDVADLNGGLPLNDTTVWQHKFATQPGSIDMHRRVDLLDYLGIANSLIFASGPGVIGTIAACSPPDVFERVTGISLGGEVDSQRVGRAMLTAHNDWCVATAAINPRLRPVAILDTTSITGSIAEVERLLPLGIKAFMLPCGILPEGDKSPSHPDLDPLWQLLAEAQVPALLHIGSEMGFLDQGWRNAPAFFDSPTNAELALNPYSLSVAHFAGQNYLTNMILGGVFERHPALRFGALELTAHWVAPMARNMENWLDQFPRHARTLSMRPSEYLQRNVRVSAFHFERVDQYIETGGLEDVYCYGSDLPHFESGHRDSRVFFADQLSHLGSEIVEKFFVTNAQLVLP